VKLTGDEKPGKETFKLEIYDCGVEDAEFEILNDVLTAEDLEFVDGGAYFYGVLKIKVTGQDQLFNLTEGFKVRMVKGTAKGWTYATEQWNVTPVIFDSTTTSDLSFGYDVRQIIDGEISEVAANCMSFTLGYEAVTEPETPKTGDSSNMLLWAALLLAGGLGTFGTVAYSKKRKEDAE
ncbi:MAG: sortase B protein-sorting domain-containing protein, partial [Firmicutes bacterium]|nr:sortase B protein-sorting domain-containing protein [Bacillota bacterium]